MSIATEQYRQGQFAEIPDMIRNVAPVDLVQELYELKEGRDVHSEAIEAAQREGRLQALDLTVGSKLVFVRSGSDKHWARISATEGACVEFIGRDWDNLVWEDLGIGDKIVAVTTKEPHPELNLGVPYNLLAAVAVGKEFLYKSPGFDAEAYIAAQPQQGK